MLNLDKIKAVQIFEDGFVHVWDGINEDIITKERLDYLLDCKEKGIKPEGYPPIPIPQRSSPRTLQTHYPRVKGDGRDVNPPNKKDGNNTSHITASPRKLKLISAKKAMEIPDCEINRLWSPFLYGRSIILLNSVSGKGKTTFCYNLAIYGARGEPFAGIPFLKKVNVLYCDLETSVELRKKKLELISEINPPDNLYFIPELNFVNDFTELKAIVIENSIDLVIVDTINEAFDTRDEQDNAEANRQFKLLKKLRDETGCCILLLAHVGKRDQSQKVNATRGASARPATADVVINLEEVTENEIRLSKEKDRIGGGKQKLYLKKVGNDAFEAMEHGEKEDMSLLIKTQCFIFDMFDKGITETSEFIERGKEAGFSKTSIERAITNLKLAGKIESVKKGVYRRVTENPKDIINSGDDLRSDGFNPSSENPSVTSNPIGDGSEGTVKPKVSVATNN